MITIYYYCTPRQVGKTKIALYEAFKTSNSIILTHNDNQARELSSKHESIKSTTYNRFISKQNTPSFRNVETLILDEYHFANLHDREKLYDYVLQYASRLKGITILTTPAKQIPHELFEYVATCKALDRTLLESIDRTRLRSTFPKWFMLPINTEGLQIMIHELWYDLLFLDYSRHNVGKFRVVFSDGDSRLPFFNYWRMREAYDREMGVLENETTGQYIVK